MQKSAQQLQKEIILDIFSYCKNKTMLTHEYDMKR